jgi:hypothetical protein
MGLRPDGSKKEAICYQYLALTGHLRIEALESKMPYKG